VVAASANNVVSMAAISGECFGSTIVDCSGETIRTTAGWRVRSTAGMWTGRINSTVIVVSVPLTVPPANVVRGMMWARKNSLSV